MNHCQGNTTTKDLPPINVDNTTVAFNNEQKSEAFADFFAKKMTVADPNRTPPKIPQVTSSTLKTFRVEKFRVLKHLKELNVTKATGPDKISPRVLKSCAQSLAHPISIILNNCVLQGKWPNAWKKSFIVPVHKKQSKAELKNYRPVSLLCVMSKICEKIICE